MHNLAKIIPMPNAAPTVLRAVRLCKRVPLPGRALSILDDVSFTIAAGEAIAIVGASGSGKSTLLSLLAGLDTPTEGEVELVGTPLGRLDEDGRARLRGAHVGFVFQSFQLLPSLTALENVMLPLELAGARDAEARARDILGRVGLGARLGHYPRQRHTLLLADEPTGNLDTATGNAVVDLLFDLNAQSGTTLVLVTHDERLAARCHRQLRLAAGRLVA